MIHVEQIVCAELQRDQQPLVGAAEILCRETFRSGLHWQSPYKVIGAAHEGELLGLANVHIGDYAAHLGKLVVSPEWRGQGVGSVLLDYTVGTAAAAGCGRISVTPLTFRNEALYARHGFVQPDPHNLAMMKAL